MTALEIGSEQYHSDQVADGPTLSASICKTLVSSSAAHAWAAHPRLNPNFERQEEQKYDRGTAAHSLLLQGIDLAHIVHAADWRTKAAQEERDIARSHGQIPLLASQWGEVRDIVAAVLARFETWGIDLAAGAPEQTLAWEMGGVDCRARLDWLSNDHASILDIKTTARSANPERWTRSLFDMGAEIQHEFYRRGVEAVFGVKPSLTFVVVECQAPFEISRVSLAPSAEEHANEKIDYALAKWKRCLETDVWPGYADQIAYAELPGYEASRWLEREAREEAL